MTFSVLFTKKTGDEKWHELEIGHFNYIVEARLKTFNWEGQFEDIKVSSNYANLTHFTTDAMINYITKHFANDEKMIDTATELMRYVEDQFVLWGEYPKRKWHEGLHFTPAGLEQYECYDPICSSTSVIMDAFIMIIECRNDYFRFDKPILSAFA